jgi:hypothetical protein
MGLQRILDKQVPRHRAHGLEYPLVGDPAGDQLLLDHPLPVDIKGRGGLT